jgi:hypothetical protein
MTSHTKTQALLDAALAALAGQLNSSQKTALVDMNVYCGANRIGFEGDAERGVAPTDARTMSLEAATARKLNKLGLARKVRKGESVGVNYAGAECFAMAAGWICTDLGEHVARIA